MKKKQYIIEFTMTKNNVRFIRSGTGKMSGGGDWYNAPTTTQEKNLISADCVFDSEEDASKYISSIRRMATKANKKLKKRKDSYISGNRWESKRYIQAEIRKSERFRDLDNYKILEFVPEFSCKLTRKTAHKEWVKHGGHSKFCTCCGSSIPYGRYVLIRKAIICPFCLRKLGQEGQGVIDEETKTNPDFENDYWCSTFVAHIE